MKEADKRWIAVTTYRTDHGPVDVQHYLEELDEIDDIVEAGPFWPCSRNWDALISFNITLNPRRLHEHNLTVEKAAQL